MKVPGSLEEWRILEEKLSALIDSSTQGAWITFNPARKELAKSAVGEEDITQYNYILVEADEISKEQQWKKLHLLDLPVETIVWSGGKSYHTLVKIEAGKDRELFKKRTKLLYNYLEQKGFPADAANKNASRLTRVPGFMRNGEMQYIAAWESGPSSWQEFEQKHLNKNTLVQAEQDPLQEQYGEPLSYTKNGDVSELNQNYFAAYTMTTKKLVYSDGFYWQYDPKTGIWNQVQENQMNNLIGDSIREYGKKCGLNLARKVTAAVCRSIRAFMAPERNDPFKSKSTRYIHVGNGILVLSNDGTFTLQPFSPDFYSRNQCKINYDPAAKCPRFLNELLSPAISPEDIALLQLYAGQCLLGDNFTQTFLLLTGTAGGGKGTIVKIIEGIIGKENHAQLRTELLGERFELGRFIGKTLLTGPDVPSDFLLKKHAGMIKSLCGHDSLTAEIKGVQGGVQLQGRFNMIITANDRLKLNVDGDAAAWKRRVLWIPYQNPPVKNKIDNFDLLLIQEEGSGILNWMLEGATKVLATGIPKNTKAQQRIENLLQESDSVYGFLNCRIEKAKGSSLTVEALYGEYESWCNRNQWTAFPMRLANGKLREGIMSIFQIPQSHDLEYWGRQTRGYHGIRIKREYSADTPDTEKEVSSIHENIQEIRKLLSDTPDTEKKVSSIHENIQEPSIQGELFFTT